MQIVFATLAMLATPSWADNRLASPQQAGQLFRVICQEAYPNVAAARQLAEQRGFQFRAATGYFEVDQPEIQLRINSEKCAIRFLTDSSKFGLLTTFSNAASIPNESIAGHGDVQIGSEAEAGGLLRVAATRTNEN